MGQDELGIIKFICFYRFMEAEDYIDDYFHVSELDSFKSCLIPLPNGHYTFDSSKINSYWDVDRLVDRIKSFTIK